MNFCIALLLVLPLTFLPSSRSVSFNITEFDNWTAGLLLQGDAKRVQGYIDLTENNEYFRVGRVVYSEPVYLSDAATKMAADFATEFTFSIEMPSRVEYSDGLTFFIAPANYPIPPNSGGGFFGLLNSTTGESFREGIVIVEFDTYPNREYDPLMAHVGININSIASAVNTSWDPVAESGKIVKCWIAYDATLKNLSVSWTYEESAVRNYSLSHHVDLGVVLPEWVTVGISAATGLHPERHMVYSWKFTSSLKPPPIPEEVQWKKQRFSKFFAVTLSCACSLFLSIGVVLCFIHVKRRKGQKDTRDGSDGDYSINKDIERRAFPRRFSHKELVAATNGFADERKLGCGSSGHVYKGFISDLDCMVAVKRAFTNKEHSQRFFINEVKIISRLIHQNLVRFIGWCHESEEFLLVYEYIPNGSLNSYLFGNRRALAWDVRYKIALGLATALHYLHEEAGQCVLHRDIKSANVLLDIDFNTKLGDFGVAKRIDSQLRTQMTDVVGTSAYIAPEYLCEGRVNKESDIFSFGIVALEIACGRQTYSQGENTVTLVQWIWQLYVSGRVLEAADERLKMGFDEKEMECLLVVGLWCTHWDDKERPKVGEVIKVLKHEIPLPALANDRHQKDHLVLYSSCTS